MTDSTNIYILKLKGGNYYVGKTDNVEKRFNERAKLKYMILILPLLLRK